MQHVIHSEKQQVHLLQLSLEQIVFVSHNSIPISDTKVHTILIGLHTCFLRFNGCRHRRSLCDSLIQQHDCHLLRLHHEAFVVLGAMWC